MDIKVEEYVRTKNGLIGKVNKIELAGSGVRFGGEFLTDTIIQFNDGKVYERRVKTQQIFKHSFNLIDLIEVGDYVNGEKVIEVHLDLGYVFVDKETELGTKTFCDYQIETILTHEQMEENQYVVKRNMETN